MFKILIISLITFMLVIIIFLIFMTFMNMDIKTNSKQIENFYNAQEPSFTGGAFKSLVNGSTEDYYIQFNSSGTLTIPSSITCDILIVGGGGGGGFDGGGGGGGGQVLYYTDKSSSFKTNSSITLNSGTYNITIGNGGIGEINRNYINGTNGGTSSIVNASTSAVIVSAKGGGGAGSRNNLGNGSDVGGAGGSGHAYGDKNGFATSINNSGRGGKAHGGNLGGGGGGGGANTIGTAKDGKDATNLGSKYGGDGGSGVDININGTLTGYGGGGGGGSWNGIGGSATHGGGVGNVNNAYGSPEAGKENTGGGGGSGGNAGGSYALGKNGGSGVVIIRYNISQSTIYTDYSSDSGTYLRDSNDKIIFEYISVYDSSIDVNLQSNIKLVTKDGISGIPTLNPTNYDENRYTNGIFNNKNDIGDYLIILFKEPIILKKIIFVSKNGTERKNAPASYDIYYIENRNFHIIESDIATSENYEATTSKLNNTYIKLLENNTPHELYVFVFKSVLGGSKLDYSNIILYIGQIPQVKSSAGSSIQKNLN